MFTLLWKKQWKTQLLLVIFFCIILLFWGERYIESVEPLLEEQAKYLQKFDLNDSETFFRELEEDKIEAENIVLAIENFEVFGEEYTKLLQDMIAGMEDPTLFLAGAANYATYEMIVWKENMLKMPGEYTNFVRTDDIMLRRLENRLVPQKNISSNIENMEEIARRGLRRNSSKFPVYQASLEQLERIETDISVADPIMAQFFLEYMEMDVYVYLIIIFCIFATFSNLKQNKLSDVILISKTGVRYYTLRQVAVTVATTVLGFVIYYLVLMAVFRIYRFPDIWNFPVQAVGGYENVMLDISVLEYALFLLFTKFLFCICVAMISSFLSLASRNTYVSAALHCIVAGIWYLVSNGKNMGDMWSALLRGGGKTLVSDFPFVCIGNSAVFHGLIYSVVLVLIALLLFGGIMACSETLMKRRVS